MSENTQDLQGEASVPSSSNTESSEPEKTSKINKLSVEKINSKIKKLEEMNQQKSRYYKQLIARKNELDKK